MLELAMNRRLRATMERLVTLPDQAPVPIERYRALALTLQRLASKADARTLVITSALPGEGKSLTSANLALTLSHSYGARVLLVDGDFRRPRLRDMLEPASGAASTGAESLPADLASTFALTPLDQRLALLESADPPVTDPIRLLGSPEMKRALDWSRRTHEWVLVDSPPAVLVPDPTILAGLAQGVLLVVQTATTPSAAVQRAVATIGRDRIVGIVMNRVPRELEKGALGYNDRRYKGYYDTHASGRLSH
jgi:capsular exopolysaccharide synthesis family protein